MNFYDKIINFIDLLDNSENLLKITFSNNNTSSGLLCSTLDAKSNTNNFIKSIDIFDENKFDKLMKYINSLKQKHKYEHHDIIRENYYSQIRETTKNNMQQIYVEELNLLDIIQYSPNDKQKIDYNIYVIQSNKIKQNKYSFPNLNKYHFEKNISIDEYIFDGFKLMIENNIIYIEINKKIYEKDILNQIINIILDF
jgi:hypothetical protein